MSERTVLEQAHPDCREVVRVATNNNFNCTEREFKQLDEFVKKNPHRYFFINSNIKTRSLLNINDHPYDAVITVNPDIRVVRSQVDRLYRVDPAKIAFTRVKYIPGPREILDLIDELHDKDYTVVVTMQRFNSIKSASKYVPDYRDHYEFSHKRFRLTPEAQGKLEEYTDSKDKVYICDRAGKGCLGCGLCSTLTAGPRLPIKSLNLSSSGICKFRCPDCYARTMQNFLRACEQPPIRFDTIKANKKQDGSLKHIRDHS